MKTFKEFLKEDTQDHRIQLRGHCPICGSIQAVTRGTMAKHGYTVKDGWFQGACSGDRFGSLESDRKPTDEMNEQIRKDLIKIRSRISEYESGVDHPPMVLESRKYKAKAINWDDATPEAQQEGIRHAVHVLTSRIRGGEMHIDMMSKLADKVHGSAHQEVKISKLPKVGIQVGDLVKVSGREVTVSKIDIARAEGVGPSLNGQYIDHVFWESNGKTYKYPKKLARQIASQV